MTVQIPTEPFAGPMAWVSETLLTNEGLVTLDAVCTQELLAAARILKDNPIPAAVLHPDQFELTACRELTAGIKHTLDCGVGFAIIE